MLRSRGITGVIPERAEQMARRHNKGSNRGRAVSYDIDDCKNRNRVLTPTWSCGRRCTATVFVVPGV